MKSCEVTNAFIDAKTPAQKAWATRKLNFYVEQQRKFGHDPIRTKAAIKANVTKRQQVLDFAHGIFNN